jgi:hypothetical protein
MKNYSRLNIILGWIIFLIASYTYVSTIEPTASFWDCGEFISASYKLEVGHPPGAPFFLLVGRVFSLFAGKDSAKVALMINTMSALASAFTILFLFWTITHLVRKVIGNSEEELEISDKIIILGSGVIGSLVYTFSDTFWFSAVEGEVYASSSLFTAIVFWAILKWENIADTKYANRWLILIAYLMGLSIGVHLLNLLAIPAIVLIYYFKNYKVTRNGLIAALGLSAVILGGVIYILIPGLVKFASLFELLFVNGFGLPYFSGMFFYLVLLFVLIAYGIYYTQKHQKVIANTVLLAVTVIIIGYSSYAQIVIRSLANPPMDQNNPETLFNLLSYLNREQYGDRPLVYGQYFNAPAMNAGNRKAVYEPINGKYKVITYKPKYAYDNKYKTIFPRMYSQTSEHIDAYIRWTNMKENELFELQLNREGKIVTDRRGNPVYNHNQPKNKPSFSKNIVFFIKYQLGHMYFRYFMWNFSGRQNDIQGHFKEEITSGNWITGIKFLDSQRLGNQNLIPEDLLNNRARNKYYLLPLFLGLIGMIFQYKYDAKNFWVVMTLFIATGIAIVIYLNQYPLQPRERDYAYAGSFYAFTIWTGMAIAGLYKMAKETDTKILSRSVIRGSIVIVILGIFDLASNSRLTFTWTALIILLMVLLIILIMRLIGSSFKNNITIASITFLLALPVPLIIAAENWDDHDRSGRYIARDFASNYLNSCEKNATLFTNGDNDTFPLWYAQEVEGIRTDVRVINLSYLSADWYIEQMERKAYDSEPVKMTLTKEQYRQGRRDLVALYDRVKGYVDLKEAIDFVATEDAKLNAQPAGEDPIYYIPQHQFRLNADSSLVFGNGTIKPDMADKYTPVMHWEISQRYITKNHLMALDFLATNNWERPFYYAITVGNSNYLNLESFFEMNGLSYRVIPAITTDGIAYSGGINPTEMYNTLMNKFRWGGIEDKDVYLDENCVRMFSNIRHNFTSLAEALLQQGKADSARVVLEKCLELIPNSRIPFDVYMIGMVETFYKMGDQYQAREVAQRILDNTYDYIDYFLSLDSPYSSYLAYEKLLTGRALSDLINISHENGDKEFSAKIQQDLQNYGPALNSIFR